MTFKKWVKKACSVTAPVAASAMLVVGLSTNAQAATGTLTWQGDQGTQWTWRNPPSGTCSNFGGNTVAFKPHNNTGEWLTVYTEFGCSGSRALIGPGAATYNWTAYYSFRY
ncbi:hypothetical protein G3I77_37595 [Streptomyces sp. D2-8]|uniref:hypothetical protein n=1 Tax=Streptomyces sp. D2-8 TaxID=2707767 RepID=UPI0020C0A2FF|nr:hypothetical protein [Streptomyces sp. D2-8]MCK8438508.1 hypothetical protein [Streptomyces sp. D2-8]